MSSKEALINWIQQLPEDYDVRDLLVALQRRYAAETLSSGEPSAEVSDEEWRQFVAFGLRDELADPREDVYTGAEGSPIHD